MNHEIHPGARIPGSVKLGHNVHVHEGVELGDHVSIGSNVVLHPGTVLGEGVAVSDNAVLGRPPRTAGSHMRPAATGLPPLRIGPGSVVGSCAVLYRGATIGSNTLVADLASIREGCEIGDDCVIARAVILNYNCKVGSRTKVMDQTHLTGNMIIEEDCFISLLVGTANDNTIGSEPVDPSSIRGPHIKRGASIGMHVAILPAKTIGEYAVVGAGAVVTQDIPDYAVAMGIPARVVRYRTRPASRG